MDTLKGIGYIAGGIIFVVAGLKLLILAFIGYALIHGLIAAPGIVARWTKWYIIGGIQPLPRGR